MERADKDLAFMLQYENIAWFSDGKVKILDPCLYSHTASHTTETMQTHKHTN